MAPEERANLEMRAKASAGKRAVRAVAVSPVPIAGGGHHCLRLQSHRSLPLVRKALAARRRIIKAVVDRDNRVVLQFLPKVVCQAVQPEAAAQMVEALRGVVSDAGTAEGAQVPGYEVAGKTGTARKVVGGEYAVGKYRSSFIGFLPAEKPEFLVSILVDDPKGKVYYGGLVAGPAFKNIATQVAEQLHLNRGASVVARRSAL